MKRCKAAGGDQVTSDPLKDGGLILLEKLATLYTQYLMTSSVPESWKNGDIIFNHKKGDAKDVKHYKPVSLLPVAYEVFTNVIGNRVRTTLDFNEPTDQAGFRKGYSTIDRIHTINHAIEECAEHNQAL